MSNKKISILDMEKSNIEFKKSHYVSVSGFKPQTDMIPDWFKKFHEEEFKPLRDAFIESQTKPPKYFIDFVNEQREFNKQLLSLFNQVLTRIDNLVAKNNLKE